MTGFYPDRLTRVDTQRRSLLRGLGGLTVLGWMPPSAWAAATGPLPGYAAWKTSFVQADGRVAVEEQVGLSEAQGYGMLLAQAAGDQEAFDRMWAWTRQNLAVREDALFAWRWVAGQGVTDPNNASDADLLIAWALARAAVRRPELASEARKIAQIIRFRLLRETPWGTVLLPAVIGFDTPAGLVVNLSYWVFPALPDLERVDPSPQWRALQASGLKLMRIARFGRWGLPPDWLLLVDPLVPDRNRPQRFGFDAVRIPLHFAWAGLESAELLAPYKAFWSHFRCDTYLPAWADLTEDVVDAAGASSGMRAIRDWIVMRRPPEIHLPTLAKEGYYSATLSLLVQVAARRVR